MAKAKTAGSAVGGIAAKWGPKVLKLAGQTVSVYGAAKEARKTYDHSYQNSGDFFKADLAAFDVLLLAFAVGAIDDAIFMTGFGAPMVTDSWEQHGSGPSQHLIGEIVRGISHWGDQHRIGW